MIIAVNTNFLLKGYKEGYGKFIYECFSIIVRRYPNHIFIFIFERPVDPSFIFSPNIIPVVIGPKAKNLLLLKFWYNYKIPAVLKKYKADLFINTDVVCSLRTNVPQLLLIHELTFLNYPELVSKKYLKYYKKYTPKFLNKAKLVTALSNFCKNNIIKNYKIDAGKIEVVYGGVDEFFSPIDFNEREKIKEQYSQGNEYFLFYFSLGPWKNLLFVLKAFSVLKKWQKSGIQLLIVASSALRSEELQSLRLFKYHKDVKILEEMQYELKQITAAAYAILDFSYYKSFGIHSLEAMKCSVPVITDNKSAMPEICGDAALYVNPNEYRDLAEKLMMIFKDEKLRKELIEKGEEQAQKYSWEKTSELFWESILKASH
ncbi:MAG: glycosyltransferase family 1 protein [Ginsengibacter sp.]